MTELSAMILTNATKERMVVLIMVPASIHSQVSIVHVMMDTQVCNIGETFEICDRGRRRSTSTRYSWRCYVNMSFLNLFSKMRSSKLIINDIN